MPNLEHYSSLIKRYWQTYPGQQKWIKDARLDGYNALEKVGLPGTKNEKWKYTNFEKMLAREFSFSDLRRHQVTLPQMPENAKYIVFCNGEFDAERSDFNQLEGIVIKTLDTVTDEEIQIFVNDRSQIDQASASTYLADAFLNDGIYIQVKKGKQIDTPIVILHISSEGEIYNLQTTHTFIHLEAESKFHFIEVFVDAVNSQIMANNNTYIHLEDRAKLGHYFLQNQHKASTFVTNTRCKVNESALYQNIAVTIGGKISRNNLHVELEKQFAHAEVHGLYALRENQHCDTSSFIHHKSAHTTSDQLYKGVLDGNARGIFTGMVRVEKDAQKIEANQLNKNMLLSRLAHANSRPQLEIFADDVKCSHGSTTGQINNDELFYFESRGISTQKARQILAHAYTYEVLMKIEDLNIRKFFEIELMNNFEKQVLLGVDHDTK